MLKALHELLPKDCKIPTMNTVTDLVGKPLRLLAFIISTFCFMQQKGPKNSVLALCVIYSFIERGLIYMYHRILKVVKSGGLGHLFWHHTWNLQGFLPLVSKFHHILQPLQNYYNIQPGSKVGTGKPKLRESLSPDDIVKSHSYL